MNTNLKEILKISSLTRSEFGNMAKRILCILCLLCSLWLPYYILYEMSFIEKPCQKSCHGQFVLFRYIFLCKIILLIGKKIGIRTKIIVSIFKITHFMPFTTRILFSCRGQIPREIGKNPGKRIFARGARAGNAPRRKCFARGYAPVKFPRGTPLSNLPGTNPCETN
jgi:hypothetical protein